MPSRAGTLAEYRTQVDLRCGRCRHEWSIEMTPPVLIVRPERETDGGELTNHPATAEQVETGERRDSSELRHQRMRLGLGGLLTSTDRTNTIPVLYSVDARGRTGRLRLIDPSRPFPVWLVAGSRLWLSAYDGLPLRIRITAVTLPTTDAEHFAEFVVPRVSP